MRRSRSPYATLAALLLALLLSACAGPREPARPIPPSGPGADGAPSGSVDAHTVPDAVPRVEPRSRYGNPATYTVMGQTYRLLDSAEGYLERGLASWYGTKFHGRRTSSGEIYDMYQMTAAHKTLPLPAYARVTNLDNGRSIVVRINDRGPFHAGRIIDLSYVAAKRLDMLQAGTARVEVRTLTPEAAPVQAGAPALIRPVDAPPVEQAPGARLYLQVGAFSHAESAEGLRRDLQDRLERPVAVSQGGTRAAPVYRVRLGPLIDIAEADALRERLGPLGIAAPHVVME